MYLPGHLAVAYLAGRGWGGAGGAPSSWLPVMVGALAPDGIDKTIQLLELSPYGRTVGHAVWVWAWLAALFLLARAGRAAGAAWLGALVVGGASHLAADLVDDVVDGFQTSGFVFSTWGGWPHTTPDTWDVRGVPHLFARSTEMVTGLEVVAVLAVSAWIARPRRQ